MTWFDKRKVSRRQVTLEEALAQGYISRPEQDQWDEDDEDELQQAKSTAVFPPRLSLQSRALPAVHIVPDRGFPTSTLEVLPARPVTVAHEAKEQKRKLGRSTRVHLQAIRPEQLHEPITENVSAVEGASDERAAMQPSRHLSPGETNLPIVIQTGSHSTRQGEPLLKAGRGEVQPGQLQIMVEDSAISEHSVVTVMLTGDPGPVVVQYISLHPQIGFTFHLSAPACSATSFNYSIWVV